MIGGEAPSAEFGDCTAKNRASVSAPDRPLTLIAPCGEHVADMDVEALNCAFGLSPPWLDQVMLNTTCLALQIKHVLAAGLTLT